MNDGGANEPTPIVHNGIMYLANTSNTVQALDGRTGELIWENRIGPASTRSVRRDAQSGDLSGQGVSCRPPMRDLFALDARTGKIVWQTVIADSRRKATAIPAVRS